MKKFGKVITFGSLILVLFFGNGINTKASTVTRPIGSTFYKSALYNNLYKVQDYKGATVIAKTTAVTTLTNYTSNKNFSFGTVSFVDYDQVAKTTYKTTTSIQAYTTDNVAYKLTAKNNLGQTVNVKMPVGVVVTKVNASWYKGKLRYTNYVKNGGIWGKETKTVTAYVPYTYVKGYTSNIWTKFTKKATGYFWTPVNNGPTLAEYDLVKEGMTYNQVVSIIGEVLSNPDIVFDPFDETYTYIYKCSNSNTNDPVYRDAAFSFVNNKLVDKNEYSLK